LIRIFRHIACEGPGFLAEVLEQKQLDFEIIAVDEGQKVPHSLTGVTGLVFLGGPMSANDSEAWIQDELSLIAQAHTVDIPMLGFCLGSQLICKALGGEVFRGEAGQEIGWHAVDRVEGSAAQYWLGDKDQPVDLFHWHGETFDLPANASLILSSQAYPHQAYVIGKTLALQCHIEVSADMVKAWAGLYTDDLAQGGQWNQTADKICENLDNRISALRAFARPLLEKWLQGVNQGSH